MPTSTPAPRDGPLTALLVEISAEASASIAYSGPHDCPDGNSCSEHNALRLLAAVEAVLELADDWATERPGESGPGYNATRACGRSIRGTITSRLTGKGDGDA